MVDGESVTSTSPSGLRAMPFWPGANESATSVPITTVESDKSPRETEISISGKFVSPVAPGPKTPPDMSSTSRSVDPTSPDTAIEFVFTVVAAPHAAGTNPNQSWPPTTVSDAAEPEPIVALTRLCRRVVGARFSLRLRRRGRSRCNGKRRCGDRSSTAPEYPPDDLHSPLPLESPITLYISHGVLASANGSGTASAARDVGARRITVRKHRVAVVHHRLGPRADADARDSGRYR